MTPVRAQDGLPTVEGRYVVFIAARSPILGWVEPMIARWHGGRWHHQEIGEPVYGWIGPLLVMKITEFFDEKPVRPAMEYDL